MLYLKPQCCSTTPATLAVLELQTGGTAFAVPQYNSRIFFDEIIWKWSGTGNVAPENVKVPWPSSSSLSPSASLLNVKVAFKGTAICVPEASAKSKVKIAVPNCSSTPLVPTIQGVEAGT